jgi:alpha-D-ribose 1-methylphosphonate 5-triphosphate diphosphatase
MRRRLITHATLVTPSGVLADHALLTEGGIIAALGPAAELAEHSANGVETLDARGAYLLPGLIDLHTDTLEKEITPRPGADFPLEVAIHELDRKLVACGITTVYHSLHMGYADAERSAASRFTRRDVVAGVRAMAGAHTLARTRIHLRYEYSGHGVEVRDLVEALIAEGAIDLLSFMDHTPGQGQYSRERFIANLIKQGKTETEAIAVLADRQARPKLTLDALREIGHRARARHIPVASHDDDTPEKVSQMHSAGVNICEFPITLAAAHAARALGLDVLGGAANVLRGGSLTGNLDITSAISAGAVNGLCSDYYPPAMLHSVFKLWRERVLPLTQAVEAATAIPARAAGIGDETGSLETGKAADLILVQLRGETPTVLQTYVQGERVHTAGREADHPVGAPAPDLAV